MIEPYHTGIIVDDVAAAIPVWEAATGVQWGSVYAGPLTVRTPASGTVTHHVELAYSSDLRLELVKLLPGTCWTVNGGTGVHHTGGWSADLEADAARLESQGWPIVAHGVDDHGAMAMFSYHQVPVSGCWNSSAAPRETCSR